MTVSQLVPIDTGGTRRDEISCAASLRKSGDFSRFWPHSGDASLARAGTHRVECDEEQRVQPARTGVNSIPTQADGLMESDSLFFLLLKSREISFYRINYFHYSYIFRVIFKVNERQL